MTDSSTVLRLPAPRVSQTLFPPQSQPRPGVGAEGTALPGTARAAVGQALQEIWAEVLEVDRVGLQADFFHLGGDSLAAVQMLARVEKVFGMPLTLATLFPEATIERLTEVLCQKPAAVEQPLLVPLQPQGSRPPFFCVHGVGGEMASFAPLARHFPQDQPFYGVQMPHVDGIARPFTNIVEMARHYLRAMRTLQPNGPYYLGGYSFGGSVALEMAQQLHAQGERVALLAVLDHTPPPVRYRKVVWHRGLAADLVGNLYWWLIDDLLFPADGKRLRVLRRAFDGATRALGKLLGRVRPASGRTDMEDIFAGARLSDWFREVLAIHYQALRDYTPRPYPGRVHLFRARARPLLRLHGFDLGWGDLAGRLEISKIPGNHSSLLVEPHVGTLARKLVDSLRKAQEARG